MKKKDIEQLAEIALRANAGDEAQAGKMVARLWRARRWAAEQIWRAEAAKDDGRRGILEEVCAAVDDALRAMERLSMPTSNARTPATISPAPVEPEPAAAAVGERQAEPKAADEYDGPLTPKSTAAKVELAVAVANSGITA